MAFNWPLGVGAGAGAGFFGGGVEDPAKGANRYLDEISRMLPGYYQPYAGMGPDLSKALMTNYEQMLWNPQEFYNKMAGGYEESPGFKMQLEQALGGANQAAAAGGMAGSPMAQQWGADIAQNMTQRDFQNYLQNKMGIYGQGLGGYENMAQRSYGASTGLGENLANILGSKAQLAYGSGAAKNQQQQLLYTILAMLGQHGLSMGAGGGL